MGFCTPAQSKSFLEQVPVLEKLLVEDGIMLFKYWLTVDQEKQEARFKERLDDPLKQWKLSPVDLLSRQKYEDYTTAREVMLKASHKRTAPWTLVDFNNQKLGRLNLIRHFIEHFPKDRPAFSQPEYKALAGKPRKEKLLGQCLNRLNPITEPSACHCFGHFRLNVGGSHRPQELPDDLAVRCDKHGHRQATRRVEILGRLIHVQYRNRIIDRMAFQERFQVRTLDFFIGQPDELDVAALLG